MKFELIDEIHENVNSIEAVLRINRVCNQKCLFCFAHIDQETNFLIDEVINEIKKIEKKYKWKNIEFVITWWEPTINPDFFKIIDYLYKRWKFIRLQTNAVFFWIDSNFEKIKPYLDKLDLFISFHSHNEKIYDYITQSKWQFPLAVKWIKNLMIASHIELNIVLNKLNIDYFFNYVDFLWKTFWDNWKYILNISMMTNMVKWNQIERLSLTYSKVIETVNKAEPVIKKHNISIAKAFWAPCDLPFCIWKKIFYFEDKVYTKTRTMSDRVKFDFCNDCLYNDYCNGIMDLYVEKYWNKEFTPIIK